jgi:SAM-dependent methyltransferase
VPLTPREGGAGSEAPYAHPVSASQPIESSRAHRRSLWEYYDRRITDRLPGIANAHEYWTGLGVEVSVEDLAVEARRLEQRLRELSPTRFVDVGAGPGTFTRLIPGTGLAIDQSPWALRTLMDQLPDVPVVRADALRLPLADRSVDRFFAAHLYGLLLSDEREHLLAEARRVAGEILILDAGRPNGARVAEWQQRTLHDGTSYRVFRRHFHAGTLASEIGGEVLFDGNFYVLVAQVSATRP